MKATETRFSGDASSAAAPVVRVRLISRIDSASSARAVEPHAARSASATRPSDSSSEIASVAVTELSSSARSAGSPVTPISTAPAIAGSSLSISSRAASSAALAGLSREKSSFGCSRTVRRVRSSFSSASGSSAPLQLKARFSPSAWAANTAAASNWKASSDALSVSLVSASRRASPTALKKFGRLWSARSPASMFEAVASPLRRRSTTSRSP